MTQWLNDLQRLVDSVPYGELQPEIVIAPNITKHRNEVSSVKVSSFETIRYDDSQKALDDIATLIQNMHDINYDGEIVFKLIMEQGAIKRVAYYNERITNYSELKQNGTKQKAANTKKQPSRN